MLMLLVSLFIFPVFCYFTLLSNSIIFKLAVKYIKPLTYAKWLWTYSIPLFKSFLMIHIWLLCGAGLYLPIAIGFIPELISYVWWWSCFTTKYEGPSRQSYGSRARYYYDKIRLSSPKT